MPEAVVTLEEAKLWLRFDGNWEDETITTLIGAASEWAHAVADLWDGTLPAPDRVRLAALTLIAEWFDTRQATGEGTLTPYPNGPQFLVSHLRTLDV